MHVRLINPFVAVIYRLDTVATAKNSGGKPGYDPTFREPDVRTVNGQRISGRAEKKPVRVRVQVEDRVWEALRLTDAGQSPQISLALVADYQDLKRNELVDCDTGRVLLNPNDRLDRIEDLRGNIVQVVTNPPGLFCLEVRPMSYGIGQTLNLVCLVFQDRSREAKLSG